MNTAEKIKLTKFSKGSGCGCKIDPAVLHKILSGNESTKSFSSLLGGYETNDDAAIWDLGQDILLLSTTDFFTPVVDDAFDFGRIAAANAVSDIYAMGGKPAFALAILGYPIEKLPVELANEIIAGARNICEKAGIPLAGGHSIDSPEPVFGLAVNGFVKKKNLKRNNTANKNDQLFITKPLGIGILSSAIKREKISSDDEKKAIDIMVKLNDIGEKVAMIDGVNAMTDVTGFGLLGHLIEMCEGSKLSATIDYKKIPLIDGISKYADQFIFPDNTYRNWNAYEKKVKGINGPAFITLCDPQTSGGLLISVGEDRVKDIIQLFKEEGLNDFISPIGSLKEMGEYVVEVLNG